MCGLRERSSRDRWRVSKCGACVYIAHNFVTAYVNYFGLMWGGRESVWDPLSVSHTWDSRFSRRVVLFEIFAFSLSFFLPAVFEPTVSRGSWVHLSTACCRVFSLTCLHKILFFSFTFLRKVIYILKLFFKTRLKKG